MNKNSVIFFLPTFFPFDCGGSELQATLLAKQLIKDGFKICLYTAGNKTTPLKSIFDGIEVYRFKLISAKSRMKEKKIDSKPKIDYTNISGIESQYPCSKTNLRFLIYQLNFFICSLIQFSKVSRKSKIIYLPTITWVAVVVAVIGKVYGKVVVIKDSTMNGFEVMYLSPLKQVFRKFLIKNCYFVAMTNEINDQFLKYKIPSSKIFKISNGINTNKIITKKKKYSKKCLFVGNLTQQPAKGIDVLLKSWVNVLNVHHNSILYILGRGPIEAYKEFTDYLNIASSVIFLGHVPPEEFYKESDIFILPSRREGMSNALMEAMLYGNAVIATDISGNKDLIDSGENGILVPVNDINSLSFAIIELLNDEEKIRKFGKNARQKILKEYSIEDISKKYIDLFKFVF